MRALIATSCLLAQLALGQVYEVEVLQPGPSNNRIDLVFLGDGYTATEQTKLTNDIRTIVTGLFGLSPYADYRQLFNVKLVHVISQESGASFVNGVTRNTALNGTFGCFGVARNICISNGQALTVLAQNTPEWDVAVAVVNDTTYGGSGGSIVTMSINENAVDILRHELGHKLGQLADEYDAAYPTYPTCAANDCPEANATRLTTFGQLKWNVWVDAGTPIPTPETSGYTGVGLFEGARYQTQGVFRPVNTDCLMKELGRPFCPVCAEGLTLGIWNLVDPLDLALPASPLRISRCEPLHLEIVTAPAPGLQRVWRLDGVPVPDAGDRFDLPAEALPLGNHTVQLELRDGTPFVRNDPQALTRSSTSWNIEVTTCSGVGTCTTASDCDGGFCADGVCCQSACDDVCGACNVLGKEGTCTALAGAPREGRTCAVDATCLRLACGGDAGTCICEQRMEVNPMVDPLLPAPEPKKPEGCHCGSAGSFIALAGLLLTRRAWRRRRSSA